MGFFGGSKTYVSSSIWNLAGDPAHRTSYLKTLVIGGIIGNTPSIGETIHDGYFNGPGMKLRSFFRWATNHYGDIGVPGGSLGSSLHIDASVVAGEIPAPTGFHVEVQRVDAGAMDYSYWAEQWMMDNHPDLLDTDWTSDISDTTNAITITFADTTTTSFTPTGLVQGGGYIYAAFNLVNDTTQDWGDVKMFIYQVGTGNATLDALIADTLDDGEYVPFIPIRLDNQFLSETYQPDAYHLAKKAYRRAVGKNFDDIIDMIADNEHLTDIDYAYIFYGVPLNVKEQASREYLFRFFDKCRVSQTVDGDEFALAQAEAESFETDMATWQEWKVAQADPTDPLYGTPEPVRPAQAGLPGSQVHIASSGTLDTNFNITIKWGSITKTTGTGILDTTKKVGDVWLSTGVSTSLSGSGILSGDRIISKLDQEIGQTVINWQVDEDNWETLTIAGLTHENLIYKKKAVTITASEALADDEESGFLIPLHMATVREMRLVDSTQMMTCASYVVFNAYKVVKQKWYQTSFFKLVVFVAIIAITVATGGAGAVGAGILGSAAAVGAAIGLTGFIGLLAGAIINAIAAMIISQLLMVASTAVFGAKFGALIGTIASFVAINMGSSLMSGMSFSSLMTSMSSAQNIIGMTSSLSNGVSGFMQAEAASTMKKTQKLEHDTKAKLADIQDQFEKEFGSGRAMLNPMGSTDTQFGNFQETGDAFLSRTLMTGSDIAQMSIDLVTQFPRYSLELALK